MSLSKARLASSGLSAAQQSIGGDVADETKIQLFDPMQPKLERVRPELLEPYQTEEAVEGPDLRAHWRTIQKRRWTILSILLVTFTIVSIVTWKQKAVYRADALLEIQKENANIPTVQELFQLENVSDNYLETQYKVLQSETLARRVIDQLHLERDSEFNPPKNGWFQAKAQAAAPTPDSPVDPDVEQTVLREFKDRLSVDPVRRSRLVQISFESEDPKVAAQAVNALAANYIQENLESRWQAAQKASEWLSQQLESFKAKARKIGRRSSRLCAEKRSAFSGDAKGRHRKYCQREASPAPGRVDQGAGGALCEGIRLPIDGVGRLQRASRCRRQQIDAGADRAFGGTRTAKGGVDVRRLTVTIQK